MVGLAPIVLLALILRATGILVFLPTQFGLSERAVFAAHNLERGHVIRAGDFYTAATASHSNSFKDASGVEGLIIETPLVTRDKPIRHEDVLRLQVVAVRDIVPRSLITPETVALKWTKYEDRAVVDLAALKDHHATHAIRNGDVVISSLVDF